MVTESTRGSAKALLQNRRKSVKLFNNLTLTSGGLLKGSAVFFKMKIYSKLKGFIANWLKDHFIRRYEWPNKSYYNNGNFYSLLIDKKTVRPYKK